VVHLHSVTDNDAREESTLSLRVRPYSADDIAAWDRYVQNHAHGTPFHLIAWKKTIQDVFGYGQHYLVAEAGGQIRGILPLFVVQNLLIGKALISTPFAVYGGALADGPDVQAAFATALTELGRDLQVDYVELRNSRPEQRLGFTPVDAYASFEQPIGPDEKKLLDAIPRKTRYMVRKSLSAGFSSETHHTVTAGFLDLYSKNLRRLGTPCFPDRYFRELMKNFHGTIDVRNVMHKGKVASAVLTFYFRDQVLPYYGASDPLMNSLAPNYFMYFDLIRMKGNEGYRVFDFGRSKKRGSTSYDFKSHWGMTERELPYEMLLVNRKELPNFRPTNRAFRWPLAIWKRLPLPLTRWIGPFFVRLVP